MNAQVYRAEWRNIQSVAVKQLKQHDARNDIRFLREIAILKECRSGHVVQFLVRLLPATCPSCGAKDSGSGRTRILLWACPKYRCAKAYGGVRDILDMADCCWQCTRKHGS